MLKALDSAVSVTCWSCAAAHDASALFCPHCNKIQPAAQADYFSIFGLEPRLEIDLAALEREFHRLSRKLHPDRFARATEQEKEWSLADTALLNDAYRTLKDPILRTEYLLKLNGAEIGEEHSGKNGPSRAPADLLEEVFELNMQLEEMRMAKKMGEEEPALARDLAAAQKKFSGLLGEVDQDLRGEWKRWDESDKTAGDETARRAAEQAMIALLDRRRYLRNLVRDVNEVLGV